MGAGRTVPSWDAETESIRAGGGSQSDPELRSSRAGRRRRGALALAHRGSVERPGEALTKLPSHGLEWTRLLNKRWQEEGTHEIFH